jgi:hypothetical protein
MPNVLAHLEKAKNKQMDVDKEKTREVMLWSMGGRLKAILCCHLSTVSLF